MKTTKKFATLALVGLVLAIAACLLYSYGTHAAVPEKAADAALLQMNDTDAGAMEARAAIKGISDADSLTGFGIGAAVFVAWMSIFAAMHFTKKAPAAVALLATVLMAGGCRKPYDVPEYVEIAPSETAFMVPMEGDSGKQVKLDSESSYEKIMTKRVLIAKRWNQTGRWEHQGQWMPTVKVIKVDRSPVTREWDPGKDKNVSAIWTESADSVGFSCGITCTAYIKEGDAAKFLYWYPSGSLASVMDNELRARIQQNMAEFCAKFPMDTLREQKVEMMQTIRDDVNKFFEPRGVTISTIGMFGGFTYENKQIQDSIDAVFVAQQEKAREKALLEAMDSKKKRMTDEGMAEANKAKAVAQGEADAVIMRKKAEAEGIEMVTKALDAAKSNPLFIQLKGLEVESERIKKWNGNVPTMMMGNGQSIIPMVQIPDTAK